MATKQSLFLDRNVGAIGKVWGVIKLIGMSYPATLVYYVILLQQSKEIEAGLSPAFMVELWIAIGLAALIGIFLRIVARNLVEFRWQAHSGCRRQIGNTSFSARFGNSFQLLASCFTLALLLFYIVEKLNQFGYFPRATDVARSGGLILGQYALRRQFCHLFASFGGTYGIHKRSCRGMARER